MPTQELLVAVLLGDVGTQHQLLHETLPLLPPAAWPSANQLLEVASLARGRSMGMVARTFCNKNMSCTDMALC